MDSDVEEFLLNWGILLQMLNLSWEFEFEFGFGFDVNHLCLRVSKASVTLWNIERKFNEQLMKVAALFNNSLPLFPCFPVKHPFFSSPYPPVFSNGLYHIDQKSMTGIIAGVSIALACIVMCALILISKGRPR